MRRKSNFKGISFSLRDMINIGKSINFAELFNPPILIITNNHTSVL